MELKAVRKDRGMTQRELAEKSGVPWRTIQNWEEKGVEGARVGNLKKVAEALGCDIRALLY